jgi:hypothetical protein
MKALFFVLLLAGLAAADRSRSDDDISLQAPSTFARVYPTVLDNFEKTVIQSTLRGFQIRADTFSGMHKHPYDPSVRGLWLDVEVRGPEEMPIFQDRHQVDGDIVTRTVKFSATKSNPDYSLRITFAFGVFADASSILEINTSIDQLISQRHLKANWSETSVDFPADVRKASDSNPTGTLGPRIPVYMLSGVVQEKTPQGYLISVTGAVPSEEIISERHLPADSRWELQMHLPPGLYVLSLEFPGDSSYKTGDRINCLVNYDAALPPHIIKGKAYKDIEESPRT